MPLGEGSSSFAQGGTYISPLIEILNAGRPLRLIPGDRLPCNLEIEPVR